MIETFGIGPGVDIVARLAAQHRTIGALLSHACLELTAVRVDVTSGAAAILEMKGQYLVGPPGSTFLVTRDARNHRVRALQRETRIAMHGDRKSRAVKIIDRVTGFATILIWSFGELSVMRVLMAIRAVLKSHLENRVGPSRDVALAAFHTGVLAQQWIRRRSMCLHVE